jgi:hypothetical protein
MKVGCIQRGLIQGARSTKKVLKIVNISHNRQFCGFIFKFVWAIYGGDLTGFCQYFRKVILKNDQRQTKSKKAQKVHGYLPL